MEGRIDWVRVENRIPSIEPNIFRSKSKFVVIQEFGCAPTLGIAYCFQSAERGQHLTWYLDERFYGLECPMHAGEVIAWMDIPELPKLEPLKIKIHQLKPGKIMRRYS